MTHAGVLGLAVTLAAMAGCAQIQTEGRAVDDLVVGMRSDDFTQRQAATAEILHRDVDILRYMVIPRLALESARRPLEISTSGGNMVRGRVTGGDAQYIDLEVTERTARGAVARFSIESIKVIRLFSP